MDLQIIHSEKEKKIKLFLNNYNLIDIPLNESEIDQVYNLFFNNIIEKNISSNVAFYYGRYYEYCNGKKNYDNMMKYYLISIERGNSYAMNSLAFYFKKQKKYYKMKKYYLMAIERDNSSAMKNLGFYYKQEKDYVNMMKYYLMAVERGNSGAMTNLGFYYKQQKDYVNMMKYYLMAIERNHSTAMINLGFYYKQQKDYVNMMKYYLMAFEKDNLKAITYLKYVDDNTKIGYLFNIVKNSEKKINELENKIIELECKPYGPQYYVAKEHFESLIN